MTAFIAPRLPPLYSAAHVTGSGTLYTAAYFPAEGRVELVWTHHRWTESFDCFQGLQHNETYAHQP